MSHNVNAPGQYWIVKKPDSEGTIVAKYETTADDPSSISQEIPDSCITESVADRSELSEKSIDPSVLTIGEQEILGVQ